jgi:hypothetical protein
MARAVKSSLGTLAATKAVVQNSMHAITTKKRLGTMEPVSISHAPLWDAPRQARATTTPLRSLKMVPVNMIRALGA